MTAPTITPKDDRTYTDGAAYFDTPEGITVKVSAADVDEVGRFRSSCCDWLPPRCRCA